ncbi:hypothetical protein GF325_14210, partial [Candidatus Bathyarchaeota archaeon]|nr:hypothetical protein [Candidatus Bathyarchaeota archaeon]
MARILLLEPFKKLPQSTDPLDIAVLEHFGRIIVEHAGFMPSGIHGPPLGLAQLAAMLHQRGHEACHEPFIIKAHRRELKDAYIEKKIRAHDFDVVGLSIGDPLSGVEARRYARIVKAINDTVPIIAGGMQPSFFPREFLQDESIDFVIRGKGEVAFPDLVEQLHENSQLMHVQGACSKENITSDFAKEIPLSSLPPVDLDAVQGKVYLKRNPFANIQTSRGCPFNCPF